MTILLLERKAGLSHFTDAVVQRADVQDMIRRVRYYVGPRIRQACRARRVVANPCWSKTASSKFT